LGATILNKAKDAMRKKPSKHKPKPADALVKTTKKKDIELAEKELEKVSGGLFKVVLGGEGKKIKY
jgi:hypothetical protein